MKRSIFFCLLAICATALFSCKDVANMNGRTPILYDSIRITKVVPYQSLHIELNDEWTEITVVVGDPKFYEASAEEKNKKAEELGRMIARIYGSENYLDKGNLIVTKDVNNTSNAPADGIKTPIDVAKAKKEVFPN